MTKRYFKKSKDVPATLGFVQEVKSEILYKIDSLESRMVGLFKEMKGELQSMKADMYSLKAICEEQNAQNKYVMDGLEILRVQQERLEEKVQVSR